MNINIQVQGKPDYSIPIPSQTCRPVKETYFVVLSAHESENSVPMLSLRVPLAEFDSLQAARACADTITAALALGTKPLITEG